MKVYKVQIEFFVEVDYHQGVNEALDKVEELCPKLLASEVTNIRFDLQKDVD